MGTTTTGEDNVSTPSPSSFSVIPGDYRFVFAVSTISSVFVYDTQHIHPIAKFSGLHYAAINDLSWSEDGTVLTACSSDGYLSFFRFPLGTLGERLDNDLVPELIKKARPCMFDYVPPCLDVVLVQNSELNTANIINTNSKELIDKELIEGSSPIASTDEAPTTANGDDEAPITANDDDEAPTIITINDEDEAPAVITNDITTIIPVNASNIIVGEASSTTITVNDEDPLITMNGEDDAPITITMNGEDEAIVLDDKASATISREVHFNEDAQLGIRTSSSDVVEKNEPAVMMMNVMEDTTTSPDIAAPAASAAALTPMIPSTSTSSLSVEEKKRKRIQPTLIASLIGNSSIVVVTPSVSLVPSSHETESSMKTTPVLNIDHTDKEVHSQIVLSSPVPDENINSANRAHSELEEEEKEDKYAVDKGKNECEVALTSSIFPPASKKDDGDECTTTELTDSQRKRKRIAPTLIATYTGSSSSCALVATTSVNSTTSKIIQQANQVV